MWCCQVAVGRRQRRRAWRAERRADMWCTERRRRFRAVTQGPGEYCIILSSFSALLRCTALAAGTLSGSGSDWCG